MSSRLRLAFGALLLGTGLLLAALPAVASSPADRSRIAALLASAEKAIDNSARPTAAVPLSRRALALAVGIGDAQLEARARRDLAWALVIENDAEGLARAQEAVAAARRAGDRVLEASSLDLVGNAEYYRDRHASALRHFREALTLARASGNSELEATAWKDIGATLHVLGELDEAMLALRRAADLFLSLGERPEAASALSNLGSCYSDLGADGLALDAYERSLAVSYELGHAPLIADLLTRIGFHLLKLGRAEAALQRFDEAIALARRHGLGFVVGWASAGRQQALFESGLTAGAVAEAEEDFRQSELAGDRTRGSKDLEGLCRFLLASDPARSRDCFARLIARAEPSDRRVWVAHAGLARARLRLGDPDGAIDAYQSAIENIQSLRAGVLSEEHRASFFGSFASVFDEFAGVLLERHSPEPSAADASRAFEVLERGRAQARLEGLEERRLDLPGRVPEELLSGEYALEARLAELENQTPASDAALATQGAQLEQTEERLDALRVEMRRRDPRAVGLAGIAVTSAAQLQASLDDRTAVVVFAITPRTAWSLVATKGSLRATRLPFRTESIGDEVANYVGLLSRSENADWRPFGRRLHAALVAPWLRRLPTGIRRLVLVPDGALHSLPFEVLEDGGAKSRRLLEDFAVSYSPSATVWRRLEEAHGSRGGPRFDLLAIANPSAGPARQSGTSRLYADEGYRSRPLRFADAEVDAISRYGGPGSQTRTGAAASEYSVKRSALERFRVLHFAAHAFVSDHVPWRSALLLPGNEPGQEDGFLQAREISRLRLDSDLVVLSACQSGAGQLLPGEGLQGLAEAFFDAGARSVVASLWDIDDERTARFMQDFYGHLADGEPITEALASGKRDQLRRDPELAARYWAPFVLIGDSSGSIPLHRPIGRQRWAELGAAAMLAVASGIVLRRRSRAVSGARD